MTELPTLFTVGHSTHDQPTFLQLLLKNEITSIADVRSNPRSRYAPQFNRSALKHTLSAHGISYVFLGRELGARSPDPSCYVGGRVQYARLAQSSEFAKGIDRLLAGATSQRIAIMCAEQEPLDCHRTVLISGVLVTKGARVSHILPSGDVENHSTAMERLMSNFGLENADLFRTPEERLEEALRLQEQRIAYVNQERAAEVVACE